MRSIKSWGVALGAAVLCCAQGLAASWMTDYDAALAKAKAENKPVLINFTGSDWCGWCIKLKGEVFNKPEFTAFADHNVILLELDFPRRKQMPATARRANQALLEKYGVEGLPTILVTDGDGKPKGQLGYEPGGPPAFIKELKTVPGFDWKDAESAAPAAAAAPKAAARDEAPWGGLVTPPKQYTDLKLTGLSGSANRRFAIINNQTFAAGESAKVKLNNSQVKVLCKEIRSKSVLVQVDGSSESVELFLGQN